MFKLPVSLFADVFVRDIYWYMTVIMPPKKLQFDSDMKSMESFEETPLLVAIVTYISYGVLIIFGHIRELLRKCNFEKVPVPSEYLIEVNLL